MYIKSRVNPSALFVAAVLSGICDVIYGHLEREKTFQSVTRQRSLIKASKFPSSSHHVNAYRARKCSREKNIVMTFIENSQRFKCGTLSGVSHGNMRNNVFVKLPCTGTSNMYDANFILCLPSNVENYSRSGMCKPLVLRCRILRIFLHASENRMTSRVKIFEWK